MKVALNASQTLQPDLASSRLTQQLELTRNRMTTHVGWNSKSEASSFKHLLIRPCGTLESGLAASITRKRRLQPHVSVKTRHRGLDGR